MRIFLIIIDPAASDKYIRPPGYGRSVRQAARLWQISTPGRQVTADQYARPPGYGRSVRQMVAAVLVDQLQRRPLSFGGGCSTTVSVSATTGKLFSDMSLPRLHHISSGIVPVSCVCARFQGVLLPRLHHMNPEIVPVFCVCACFQEVLLPRFHHISPGIVPGQSQNREATAPRHKKARGRNPATKKHPGAKTPGHSAFI